MSIIRKGLLGTLIVALGVLLLSSCAPTAPKAPEPVEPVTYDVTGTWAFTSEVIAPDCGGDKTDKATWEISQEGNKITFKKGDSIWSAVGSGSTIRVAKAQMGKVTVYGYKLMVNQEANLIKGKVDWDYDGGVCYGVSNITYEKK